MANQLPTLAELRSLLIECNGNMRALSRALDIHHNTLTGLMGCLLRDLIMSGDGIDADEGRGDVNAGNVPDSPQ